MPKRQMLWTFYSLPMKRRLFILAAAVSLLLWLATGVLWVRSYFVGGAISRSWVKKFSFPQADWEQWELTSICGGIRLQQYHIVGAMYVGAGQPWKYSRVRIAPRGSEYPYWSDSALTGDRRFAGFQLAESQWTNNGTRQTVRVAVIPWWSGQ